MGLISIEFMAYYKKDGKHHLLSKEVKIHENVYVPVPEVISLGIGHAHMKLYRAEVNEVTHKEPIIEKINGIDDLNLFWDHLYRICRIKRGSQKLMSVWNDLSDITPSFPYSVDRWANVCMLYSDLQPYIDLELPGLPGLSGLPGLNMAVTKDFEHLIEELNKEVYRTATNYEWAKGLPFYLTYIFEGFYEDKWKKAVKNLKDMEKYRNDLAETEKKNIKLRGYYENLVKQVQDKIEDSKILDTVEADDLVICFHAF